MATAIRKGSNTEKNQKNLKQTTIFNKSKKGNTNKSLAKNNRKSNANKKRSVRTTWIFNKNK